MGASLLAKAMSQSMRMLDVLASSRAGSLPQGAVVYMSFVAAEDPMWERACSRKRCVSLR
ncbi:hypothetical protein ELZ14_27440 [Pseudomonas brassicacearum]|nr:hypothetical protein ELZ14_27440 [Pseudomonas brassicacearum]